MDGLSAAYVLGPLLLMAAWGLIAPRFATRRKQRRELALAELTRRLWGDAPVAPSTSLAGRDRVMFVEMPGWEQRLDHRLEDGRGLELGSALEDPRPGKLSANGQRSRFKTVRVVVADASGGRELEIVRPSGLRVPPLEVFDAVGARVGTLAREGRRAFALRDAAGMQIGTIVRRSKRYRIDYEILDATGAPVGSISDLNHVAARSPGAAALEPLVKTVGRSQPSEHVLELEHHADQTLRRLSLAAAASVFLYLQSPPGSGD